MGKIGFVFAGQGAQYTGMGESLSKCSSAAAELFKKIDSVRPGTSKQCFEADAQELMKTDVTHQCRRGGRLLPRRACGSYICRLADT